MTSNPASAILPSLSSSILSTSSTLPLERAPHLLCTPSFITNEAQTRRAFKRHEIEMKFGTIALGLLPLAAAAQGANDTLLWGAYRPNLYFGLRPRIPQSLMTGLMWFGTQDYNSISSKAVAVFSLDFHSLTPL